MERVRDELKPTYHLLGEVMPNMELPKEAFNKLRRQYRADIILDALEKSFEGRILGLTTEDLYADTLNFVFGQAKVNGRVAIISLKRLDPNFYKIPSQQTLEDRASKEAIHELGHCFKLRHCINKQCVMSFSNTIADVDRKGKELCEMCKVQLNL